MYDINFSSRAADEQQQVARARPQRRAQRRHLRIIQPRLDRRHAVQQVVLQHPAGAQILINETGRMCVSAAQGCQHPSAPATSGNWQCMAEASSHLQKCRHNLQQFGGCSCLCMAEHTLDTPTNSLLAWDYPASAPPLEH